jgi:ATP synthase protein I
VKKRLRHLPASLLASAALTLVGVPVAGLVAGWAGALGGLAGIALVAVSYLISSLVVAWVDLVARHLLLVVVLMTYVVKFAVFGVVMWSVAETEWAGLPPMGVAIIVATVVWTGAQFWWITHAKLPYVEIGVEISHTDPSAGPSS